jgi:hypothetical protein
MTHHQNPPPPDPSGFPSLPILSPNEVRRPDSERFGALFYLAVFGLVVIVALLAWFGWSVWSLRGVWANVYRLHDTGRPEAERVEAAYALAHDPAVNQRQLWDIALRTTVPPLGRYVVAEGLTAEATEADPSGYGAAVARSEGWPVWLRLVLLRPLAYRAALDLPVPRDSLRVLADHDDPSIALWATYALAAGSRGDPEARKTLRENAGRDGPTQPLARILNAALESTRLDDRLQALDQATLWLRHHQPDAASLWKGWEVTDGRLVRVG